MMTTAEVQAENVRRISSGLAPIPDLSQNYHTRGRNPLPADRRKGRGPEIYLTPAERGLIEKAAATQGVGLATFIRDAALEAARQQKEGE